MKPVLIFVYGTLKAGYRNDYILGTSRLVGGGETVARCRLYHAGFPVLRKKSEGRRDQNAPVRGEVYLVTEPEVMAALDRLEGEGRMYHRRVKTVRLDSGKYVRAHAYVGDTKFWLDRRLQLYSLLDGKYSWPEGGLHQTP